MAAAGSALLTQRGQLVEALSDHALDTASQVLANSLSTFSPEEIILELISPALAELGNRWAEGRIDVATEHLASHFLRERLLSWILERASSLRSAPRPARLRARRMA